MHMQLMLAVVLFFFHFHAQMKPIPSEMFRSLHFLVIVRLKSQQLISQTRYLLKHLKFSKCYKMLTFKSELLIKVE